MASEFPILNVVAVCLMAVVVVACPTRAWSQSKEIYEAYNMYRSVPATSSAQLGVINEGFFDSDGLTLRLKQRICSPPAETLITQEKMNRCAPQAGITASSAKATKFAFLGALKALFGAEIGAEKFLVSQINVSNVCIHELSLEDAMTVLDRPSCMRAIKAARAGYSKAPLRQRLSEPGKWLLMFQTTRLMQADVTYKLTAKKGVSIDAGLKELAIKTVGRLANATALIKHESNSEVQVEAKRAFFALGPRYYEELYLPENEASDVRRNIESLARRTSGGTRRSANDASVTTAADALEALSKAADAKLDARLKAASE